jgi:RNA polymerase subunit RPABC4/transcription elongation factor Spt4
MKPCSYCGQQNDDDSVKCSGCGTEFSSASSPPATKEPLLDPALSLVTVATLHNLPEAEMLLARLEAAGIEACIPEEYTSQVFSALIPFELVTVRVAAKDAEDAKAIIADLQSALPADSSEDSGDNNLAATESSITGSVEEAVLLDGVPCVSCRALIPKDAHLCPKCGWTQPDRATA